MLTVLRIVAHSSQDEDSPAAPTAGQLLKPNVFNILSVKFNSRMQLLFAMQRVARCCAHVTYLLRAPSFTPDEVDTVLAPAIAEQLRAIKAVCCDTANRASIHQNLHLPAATHDAGESYS